jgi:hypothetical protein
MLDIRGYLFGCGHRLKYPHNLSGWVSFYEDEMVAFPALFITQPLGWPTVAPSDLPPAQEPLND